MAAALQSLRFATRNLACRPILNRATTRPIGKGRLFSTSTTQLRDYNSRKDFSWRDVEDEDAYDDIYRNRRYNEEDEEAVKKEEDPEVLRALEKANRHREAGMRQAVERKMDMWEHEQRDAKRFDNDPESYWEDAQRRSSIMAGYDPEEDEITQMESDHIGERKRRPPQTFLNLGEDEVVEEEGDEHLNDDNDAYDNLTPTGHMELEQHREMRHYARLAAWDLPMLSTMAKPFVPPTAEQCLRFRYTTYMGENHPAEKKVVLEFCTADMPGLTQLQRQKLQKLAGVRYNPETDIVKMSSEMYESQAQNKRYLGDRVDELLKEAMDPTDTFEDVPLDTRHHKFTKKLQMPKNWKLTAERKLQLAQHRERVMIAEQQRLMTGTFIDGVQQINKAFGNPEPEGEAVPELVMAGGHGGQIIAVKRAYV